jgi:enoyl-CoA hydratase/carnithine racemase
MIYTGKRVTADEALRIGLVNAVHAPDALMGAVIALALQIAEAGPTAVRASKRLMALTRGTTSVSALAEEARVFADQFAGDEQTEGMTAFIEKRKPAFARGAVEDNA